MTKLLTTTSLIISILMVTAGTATAQTQPRGFVYGTEKFTITNGDKQYIVDSKTLAGWQGLTQWFSGSPLQQNRFDLRADLSSFFGLSGAYQQQAFRLYHYNLNEIYGYLQTTIGTSTDQSVLEPSLKIADGRAVEFTPPQDGQKLDLYSSTLAIAEALERGQSTAELKIARLSPTKSLADTNDLGINELVAQGKSNFKGSPKNRRHNIAVGVEKMQGIIVAPGAEFSFNEYLGEVDGEHGFLPELVIKRTGTVPEFGGGLCQVSSTTFRAAMDAGLPIVERKNHAYAVQYYAPQGTDATIYPGVVDLRFTNDTPGHLLIWPHLVGKDDLVFDFYGTKDNRQVTLETPIQWDRKTDGSMKASWTRIVVKDGQTSSSTFKSIYQSPALYHKTEEFASTTISTAGLSMPATPQ